MERQKVGEMADSLRAEMDQIEAVLRGYEADIAKLQAQAARSPRPPECDRCPLRKRGQPRAGARDDARRPHRWRPFRSSSCSSVGPTSPRAAPKRWGIGSLEDEIEQLKTDEKIDAELQAMKAARSVQSGLAANQEEGE